MATSTYRYRLKALLNGGQNCFSLGGVTLTREWLTLDPNVRLDLSLASDIVEEELVSEVPDPAPAPKVKAAAQAPAPAPEPAAPEAPADVVLDSEPKQ